MAIALSDLLDAGTGSMREQAAAHRLTLPAFTMRELITPQYRPDDVGLERSEETWENWVGQHEAERMELRPETREQVIAAVARAVRRGERVRAVGSGHSHSNAPAPEGTYIELDPGEPGEGSSAGLNRVLDHEGWVEDDDTLAEIYEGWVEDDDTLAEIYEDLDREHLVRLEAGVVLRRLNRHLLHPEGKALVNMGSFDGQTIAGAVNTSTHGTGVGLPSVADAVRSVEIVTVPESVSGEPIVRLYRIEPTEGITNRKAFEAATADHEMELIQDDDVFRSVVVGYGCMGVVYAYTMQVVDNYWLREETKLMAWSTLKEELGRDEESVRAFLTRGDTRHCQILLNTAAEQVPAGRIQDHAREGPPLNRRPAHGVGQHEDHQDPVCMVRRHIPTAIPRATRSGLSRKPNGWPNRLRWPPERRLKLAQRIGQRLLAFHPFDDYPGKARQLHNRYFHPEFRREPFFRDRHDTVWYVALRRLQDEGAGDVSEHYRPEPPTPPAMTTEMGVPLGDVVEAVDAVREEVRDTTVLWADDDDRVRERQVFFPVPMGIRFTAESEHYLSPEHGRATAMVELPMPLPREGQTISRPLKPALPALDHDEMREQVIEPALTSVEESLRDEETGLEGRPHMGKHNTVDADWLAEHYAYFDATGTGKETGWLQAYERFNAFGTFDNAFTEQLGLEEYAAGE